jgi:ribosomal protein S18 acetylase RimI-like enzyme
MADMLVRLYSLPTMDPLREKLRADGIILRRAHPAEADIIVPWVRENFHDKWAAECRGALEHRPATCFVATAIQSVPDPDDDPYNLPPEKLIGFACYDIVAKGMFGPEGVQPDYRGRQIGKGLLLACMHAMANDGYAYAVISWAGPTEFYKNTVGATLIENSEPGIFRGPMVLE